MLQCEEEERKWAEVFARIKAEENAKKKAQEEEARKRAEEIARIKAEENAQKKAEEEERKWAEEFARIMLEENAKKKDEEEARGHSQTMWTIFRTFMTPPFPLCGPFYHTNEIRDKRFV